MRCGHSGESKALKEKVLNIESFAYVYDIHSIAFLRKAKIDTLFNFQVFFPNDSLKRLIYVADGECSSCIAQCLDFLISYSFTTIDDSSLFIILKAQNRDLFEYYRKSNTEKYNQQKVEEILKIKLFVLKEACNAPDGLYLIINNSVVDYVPWKI